MTWAASGVSHFIAGGVCTLLPALFSRKVAKIAIFSILHFMHPVDHLPVRVKQKDSGFKHGPPAHFFNQNIFFLTRTLSVQTGHKTAVIKGD
jgi:hypothetical protein